MTRATEVDAKHLIDKHKSTRFGPSLSVNAAIRISVCQTIISVLPMMRKAVNRLGHFHRQFTQRQFTQPRGFTSRKMADLTINSKYKMLSGYDIPALGYGVSNSSIYSLLQKNVDFLQDWKLGGISSENQTQC